MSRKITIEEIKRRLFETHGDVVMIHEETYVSQDKKAKFTDVVYGDWLAQVKSVIAGRRHTDFKYVNFKKSRTLTGDDVKRKLFEIHGTTVTLKPGQEYVHSHHKMIFIDDKYGEFTTGVSTVVNGYAHHPARGQHNRASKSRLARKLIHWKTGEELTCVASYESAVVEWLNMNMIDFDWQIPVKTPDGRTYYVDMFVKTGVHSNTYVEIKGTFMRKNGSISKQKWEWFHATNPNSQLWTQEKLVELGIIDRYHNVKRKAL